MPVIYNGSKLIPAPQFSCSKEYHRADDGTVLGKTYQITIKGKFVAWSGSPNSSGVFWTASGYPPEETFSETALLRAHLMKQEAIRNLFSTPGKTLEIQAVDGSMSLRCNPNVLRIDTPEGQLTTLSDYIITLESDNLFVNNTEDVDAVESSHIIKASEEWNMEVADEHLMTFRLTHSVNAIGKTVYDETGTQTTLPWQYAQIYVLNKRKLGLDPTKMAADGVVNGDSLQAYNYLRGQSVNELTGSFSVNETWLCYAGGNAYEEFTVSARTNLEGRSSVVVNGTITGLAQYDNTSQALITSRYANASTKWASVNTTLSSRATTQSGISVNPVALSKDVGQNTIAGVITYNYEYDDRPAPLLAGAKSTSITQTDDNAADVFANIPVIGRSSGPILQAIGTITAKRRVVALTAQMPAATYSTPAARPNVGSIMQNYIPNASQVFIDSDQESWTDMTGQYSRTVTYTYE